MATCSGTGMMIRGLLRAVVVGLGSGLVWAPAAWATVVGQWNMDEPPGATTMVDSSGFGNDGTLFNVVSGLPGSTPGAGDFAYGFDGVASHVTVAMNSSLVIGANNATISMSVNITKPPGTGILDYDLFRDGGATVEIIPANGKNRVRCHFAGSLGAATLNAGPNMADGVWHTISCSIASTAISATVDGVTTTKAATVGTVKHNNHPLVLGYKTDNTDFYNGLLDDVSLDISPPA